MSSESLGHSRVSVVVPCFDDGATLRETVESVTLEPHDAELVVVDDGSTDAATVALLVRLEEEGVRVLRQSNQGPSAATMAGVHATSTEYVMRLDADDVLERGALKALAAALDEAPDAAAAWGDVQTFGLTTFRIPAAPTLDPWLLTYVNCLPGAGCLVRRSTLLETGGWQLRNGFEDWDLWLALAERGRRGVYVPRVTLRYRRDAGGRQMAAARETGAHYEQLRSRHQRLFASRRDNRRLSTAPRRLKVAVSLVEALPGLPRPTRIHLCEFLTHLLWNGGPRITATMLRQALAWRLAALRGESKAPLRI